MRGAVDIEGLVKEHQSALLRYLRFLGCDDELAQDMAQDTFVATIDADFEIRDRKATSAYLRTTARNFYFMWLRKTRREVRLPEEDVLEAAWHEEERDDDGETYRRALRNCLAKLSDRARLALKLRYGENASREEIGFATGMEPEGAKTLMRRAKDKLRECIRKQVGEDPQA
ncbi:MAG: sigma-70 family RNA polymerase sigma factor [Planctomycetes bacterium]|nr:sigma-70 family RNA polymerase sigma factor [Planctomycetota bacterium]